VGITLNVNNQEVLWDFICGYCIECKKLVAFMGFICGHCIYVNGFMEVIIENDVNIICLKCVYF